MKTGFKAFVLLELDSNAIDTKLEYHDALNSRLWNLSDKPAEAYLKDDVRQALAKIANEFIEFIEISTDDIKDIIITGSNANFNWTPLSDIDLHIVADFTNNETCKSCSSEFINSCFQSKKSLWNSSHNITVKDQPVELYVQDVNEPHIASGVWSLTNNKWLITPKYIPTTYDTTAVKIKSAEIMQQIDELINSQSDDIDVFNSLKEKIRNMRRSGLQIAGEYSVENLSFKTLRNNGYLEKLSNYLGHIKDKDLSLE